MEAPELREKLSAALQGSGIDSEAVLARVQEGAGSAALEEQWLSQDLKAIADHSGFNLREPAGREAALGKLEAVHDRLGEVLSEAQLFKLSDGSEASERSAGTVAEAAADVYSPEERAELRDFAQRLERTDFNYPFSDDPEVRRAGEVQVGEARAAFDTLAARSPQHADLASLLWERSTDLISAPKAAVQPEDRALHAGDLALALRHPTEELGPITEERRDLEKLKTEMPADLLKAAVTTEINELRAEGASRAWISERSSEIEEGVRAAWAEAVMLERDAPELAQVLREAWEGPGQPLTRAEDARLTGQIEARIGATSLQNLRAGDPDALFAITDHPREQLALAKSYLQANPGDAEPGALDRVLNELTELRHVEAQSVRQEHSSKGPRHG
ncbi:hypothetical protein [Falsigemmobacter faecalis]|uniref:hypothetical protein n=1 Tax=Falsigemmobacter faecalis TaxID=2488730 RepID=UPI001F1ED51A|nr:hypothetical protein [Falsigemmobacter faecalis]